MNKEKSGEAVTGGGEAPREQGMLSRTIQTNNRSGTFSAKADYVPTLDGKVRIYDWVFDTLGIVPSGTEMRLLSLEAAQSEFRERMANGWTF